MTLTLQDYPLKTQQILRFSDTDQQGHINNAIYATFFESGRVALIYDKRHGLPPQGTSFMIAQITIRFLRETLFPGDVIIGTRVTRIGTSSLGLEQGVFKDGGCSATAESAIVLTRNDTRRSTPIPDWVRSHFETFQAAESDGQ